jgi:hypothetical protein
LRRNLPVDGEALSFGTGISRVSVQLLQLRCGNETAGDRPRKLALAVQRRPGKYMQDAVSWRLLISLLFFNEEFIHICYSIQCFFVLSFRMKNEIEKEKQFVDS